MEPTRRRSRLFTLALTACLALGTLASAMPAGARDDDSIDIGEFMTGLACTESSGRFTAENPRTGAYGKYQIMPRNWVAWSGRYLGNRWARPTPQNQEFVARQRIQDLHDLRGSWRRVAYWWLTGDGEADEAKWSRHASLYVRRVMAAVEIATVRGARRDGLLPDGCFPADLGEPRVRETPIPRVLITGRSVNVRQGPGSEFRSAGTVHRGQRVAVLGRANDDRGRRWLKVGLPKGEIGWVAKWFTRPPDSAGAR